MRFTAEQIEFLIANYATLGAIEIARRFGCTPESVRYKAHSLRHGHAASHPVKAFNPPFTEQELEFLRSNYSAMTNQGIADRLGRTAQSLPRRHRSCTCGNC